MDDQVAVMDAVGSELAVLMGSSEGAPLIPNSQVAAAGHPRERPFHDPAIAPEPLAGVDAPARAIRGVIPLVRRLRRLADESYALSAWTLAGRKHTN